MPQEPMKTFGWLLGICVSDERKKARSEALSAGLVFSSGMCASIATLYLAGVMHLL